jgi:predicted DNA-binding transcriptional regulator AlpA
MLMNINEFCAAHRISRAFFYALCRDGKGPRLTRIGPKAVRVSAEAAAEWRKACEQVAA